MSTPPHSAQSSVRVNATLLHPLVTSSVLWDHRAYGAVRHVHSFFPYYNVTDARNKFYLRTIEFIILFNLANGGALPARPPDQIEGTDRPLHATRAVLATRQPWNGLWW